MPEVFPTLATFPLSREIRFATRLNQMTDLTEYRTADSAAPLFRWDLAIGPLSDAEAATVRDFFQARGGGYESFCFFDPLDNLLQWSEDFSQAAWQKSSPADLQISGQTLTNTGASPNVVKQTIAVSTAGITFTGSVSLKAATAPVTLRLTGGAQQTVTPGSDWRRFSMTDGSVTGLEIEIAPGASVDVFGAQLVAANGPANYMRTTTVSGVHLNCRFDPSVFDHRVLAPNVNHIKLTVTEL